MSAVTLYTTRFCPYCVRARFLLDDKQVEYTDIRVDGKPELRREMMEKSGRHTVPQIWIGDYHVGGYDDLAALERAGRLDKLLAQVSAGTGKHR
ncbi:glutaredoxin 3 [Mangrovimicrobium sediminis]|uniref:Glutaredoxin n=1 Tax=Mangrovimicrobium sediminis TaxID=2562682 RepID=A0A4Z0LZI6_9GAMM|nr:glutaredoxin 3 [Haliea sp. SAOS-164]TGD72620.1 glutaredoxin 3 [Haliea sp. SAOS-164]